MTRYRYLNADDLRDHRKLNPFNISHDLSRPEESSNNLDEEAAELRDEIRAAGVLESLNSNDDLLQITAKHQKRLDYNTKIN